MNRPFAEMLRYNRWATVALLAACREIDEATLTARPSGISGTIGELLVHIVGGQQTFLCRAQGRQDDEWLGRTSAWPGFERLEEIARSSGDGLVEVAQGLDTDEDVDLPYMGKVYRFATSFFLVHAVEHGVEHRTEIKVGLAQLGIPTPDLDGWAYAAAAGHGREV